MFFITLFLLIGEIELEHIPSPFITERFLDVKKVDTLLYFVMGRGLEIYNWHPTDPQLIASFATDGRATGIDIYGNYAYIADDYKGLCIVDISNPTAPELIGYCDTDGQAHDVVVDINYAYLADMENGFVILDVSDPFAPFLVGHCPDIGHAGSVTLKDTLAYVGVFNGPLKIINIADPSNPFVIAEFPPDPSDHGTDAYIEDTLAYINCSFWSGSNRIHFAVVNVKDPANPVYVAGLSIPNTNRGIEKEGIYVYTNAQDLGVYIIDVTDPSAPFVIGQYDETYWFGYGYIVHDTLLLATQLFEGFSIVDVSDPQIPVTLYHHKNIAWRSFAFEDSLGYLYIIGQIEEDFQFYHSILKIVDISDPTNPMICGEFQLTGRGFLFEGSIDYPYLALFIRRGNPLNDTSYTAIINVSNPVAPELIRFVQTGGITDLHVPYLYCLDGAKIRIADINDPLFWIDSLSLRTGGYDLLIDGTLAYVTIPDSLFIINVETGQHIGSCYHDRPNAADISLNYPFIAVPYTLYPDSYGFLLFDVSSPSSPCLVFDTLIYEPPLSPIITVVGCELKDTLLYFCRGNYGFDIWNISYPDSIYRIITQETPKSARDIHAQYDIIFDLDHCSLELYRVIEPGIEERQLVDSRLSMPLIEVSPNPFRNRIDIRFQMEDDRYLNSGIEQSAERIELKIYDATGRLVRSFPIINLCNPNKSVVSVYWYGTDDNGTKLPQGVYFIKLQTEDKFDITKVILLK